MTYREIVSAFRQAGVGAPATDARILIEEFCKIPRERIPLLGECDLTAPELLSAVERRCRREPLQYIIGHWDFMGYDFTVTPDCLIPRPETEILVETALANLPHGGRVLDLCTGSGCVALSVMAERPDVTGALVDISRAALAVAEINCAGLGLSDRCLFLEADVTLPPPEAIAQVRYDVITANPPYITADEMWGLEPELAHEPRIALTDEGDGMSVIRGILENYPALLNDGGILAVEIGSGEGSATLEAARSLGLACEIIPDLAGLDRVAVVKSLRDFK